MVMYAPYRCCECGESPRCCDLWCECPEEITVSFCSRERSRELIACTSGLTCHPAAGTVVGSTFTSVHVTGVKFKKKTGPDPVSQCDNCCWYEVATGEEQTGTISFSVDDNLLWCSEKDGDDCVYGYKDCDGSKTMSLSGNTAVWNIASLSGYLGVNCCNSQQCDADTFKAKLTFFVQAVHTDAGTVTDCCTQTTEDLYAAVTFNAGYDWECRHKSRWTGTCPEDLLDENGTGFVTWSVTSCLDGFSGQSCPCGSTPGQGSDYTAPCIVDPVVIEYCVEDYGETVTCTPTGNGIVESIA